jgi:predicted membrane protein
MHPLYRPIIFDRFSLLFAASVVSLTAIILLLSLHLLIVLVVGALGLAVLFVLRGYKILIRSDAQAVSFTDRAKTLIYFLVYNVTYLTTRIEGSIKYRQVTL